MLIRFRDGSNLPNPFSMFDDFSRELSSFFGRDVNDLLQSNQGMAIPAVNIRESDNNFQIELAAPGMRKEDFSVNVQHNILTISAQQERRMEEGNTNQNQPQGQQEGRNASSGQSAGQEQSEGAAAQQGASQGQPSIAMQTQRENKPQRYTRREFSYSSFQRSFSLPESVDAENISANYQNGILTVTVPKREEQQARLSRNIDIS